MTKAWLQDIKYCVTSEAFKAERQLLIKFSNEEEGPRMGAEIRWHVGGVWEGSPPKQWFLFR